jgi:hypothetical protein
MRSAAKSLPDGLPGRKAERRCLLARRGARRRRATSLITIHALLPHHNTRTASTPQYTHCFNTTIHALLPHHHVPRSIPLSPRLVCKSTEPSLSSTTPFFLTHPPTTSLFRQVGCNGDKDPRGSGRRLSRVLEFGEPRALFRGRLGAMWDEAPPTRLGRTTRPPVEYMDLFWKRGA